MAKFEVISEISGPEIGSGRIILSDFVFHGGQFLFFQLEDCPDGEVGVVHLPLEDGEIRVPAAPEYKILAGKKFNRIYRVTGGDDLCIWSRGVMRKKDAGPNFYDLLLARSFDEKEYVLDNVGGRTSEALSLDLSCMPDPDIVALNKFSANYFHIESYGTPGRLTLTQVGATMREVSGDDNKKAILSYSALDSQKNTMNHYYYLENQDELGYGCVGFSYPVICNGTIMVVKGVKTSNDPETGEAMLQVLGLRLSGNAPALETAELNNYLAGKRREIEASGGGFISKWLKNRSIPTDLGAIYGNACVWAPSIGPRLRRAWLVQPHDIEICAAAAVKDRLYTGDLDGNVKVIDPATGEVTKSFKFKGMIDHIHYADNSSKLAYIATRAGELHVTMPDQGHELLYSEQLDSLCGFEPEFENAQRQIDGVAGILVGRNAPQVAVKVWTKSGGHRLMFLRLTGLTSKSG